jgi:glycosyltransferase involved in cell wall biosynthesis
VSSSTPPGLRRVLMVAYEFPPVASPGAIRAGKMAKYLPRFGWEPTVLCARIIPPRRYGQPRPDDRASAPVHEVLSLEADSRSWYSFRLRRHPDVVTRSAMTAMYLVAGGALWVPPAVSRGRKILRTGQFDMIFATGHPMRSLVVGKRLKDRTGLPLVLELRDPWIAGSHQRYESPRLKHERRVEAATLGGADHVVAVTSAIVDMVEDRYPRLKGRVTLLPNGFDPDDFAPFRAKPRPRNDGKFVITNHGSILGKESMQDLLRVLSRLSRANPDFGRMVELQIIGGMTQAGIDGLCAGLDPVPRVVALPRVEHDESIRVMCESDALLLVRNETWMYSMKVFDYLASGTPILSIAPEGSIVSDLIDEAEAGFAVNAGDTQTLSDALLWLFDFRQRGVRPHPREDVVNRFEWPRIASRLAAVLDEALP